MADPSYICQQLFRSERLQEGHKLVWCSKRLRRDVAAKVRAAAFARTKNFRLKMNHRPPEGAVAAALCQRTP